MAADVGWGDPARPTVAVFDLDGTLARYDTFVQYLVGTLRRRPGRVFRTVGLPLDVVRFKAGLRDNTWLKKRFLGAIVGGLTEADLRSWSERFAENLTATGLRPSGIERLREHQARGHRTVLLSASPDLFVREVARRLEFSDCLCTVIARDNDGRCTGDLDGANCYGPEKVRRLEGLMRQERGDVHVVAYGDHRSDLPLLRWADEGYLVNPSPSLAREADGARVKVLAW